MIKLGSVEFSVVTEEEIIKSSKVTDHPVETGDSVVDNIQSEPTEVSISGMVQGQNAFKKLKQLRAYQEDKEIITYFGRNIIGSLVIQGLSTAHSGKVKGGFTFSISLKQIRVANLKTSNIDFKKVTKQSIKGLSNEGAISARRLEEGKTFEEYYHPTLPTIQETKDFMKEKILAERKKQAIELNNAYADKNKIMLKFQSDERQKIARNKYTRSISSSKVYSSTRGGTI